MAQPTLDGHFDWAAPTYDAKPHEITGVVARHAITSLNIPQITSTSVVLDNASGPGVITTAIHTVLPTSNIPSELHATDLSSAMIEKIKCKNLPGVQASVMDAQSLSFEDNKFSHIFMNFAIYTIPDPTLAIKEMHRVLSPSGCVAITTWTSMGFMSWYQRAQHHIRPDSVPFPGPAPAAWATEAALRSALIAGGFAEDKVKVERVEFNVSTKGHPDEEMKKAMSMLITKGWGEDEKKRFGEELQRVIDEDWETGMRMVGMNALVGVGMK